MNRRLCLVIFVMSLLVLPGGAIADEAGANYVVILLDTSGSMNDPMPGTHNQKMRVAQKALDTVLNQISSDTRVGLLVFSAIKRPEPWVYPLGPLDMERLTQALNSLTPSGETPLGAYIKRAADRLLDARKKNFGYGTYKLLIVTDGEAQDQNLVDRFTPDVISRGITMDVIGVAMKKDHTLATKVHSYRRADDPEALTQALIQVFAEVGGKGCGDENDTDFEELAPIPDPMASALITALESSGNQPIGQRPGQYPLNTPLVDKGTTGSSPPPNPPIKQKTTPPFLTYILIAVVIFILLKFRGGKKKKGKRRR